MKIEKHPTADGESGLTFYFKALLRDRSHYRPERHSYTYIKD